MGVYFSEMNEGKRIKSFKGEDALLHTLFEQISVHFDANASAEQITLQVNMVVHRFKHQRVGILDLDADVKEMGYREISRRESAHPSRHSDQSKETKGTGCLKVSGTDSRQCGDSEIKDKRSAHGFHEDPRTPEAAA